MSVETTRPAGTQATDTDGGGSDGGASKPARGGMFTALANRNYRIYVSGSFVSNIGTWMQRVAQDWLVLELSGDRHRRWRI